MKSTLALRALCKFKKYQHLRTSLLACPNRATMTKNVVLQCFHFFGLISACTRCYIYINLATFKLLTVPGFRLKTYFPPYPVRKRPSSTLGVRNFLTHDS